MAEAPERSIAQACRDVLLTADPHGKRVLARAVVRAWRRGDLAHRFDVAMPDGPARPAEPELLPPNRMPKRGKMGSERSRIAMLHALAHIEFVAIDLAFDLVGRFGAEFPRAFVDDWLGVGAEEAMHFALLDRRLRQHGSHYGALPAHDGLWEAAEETAHDALARLAVVPMVLEARALDITPTTIERFTAARDVTSAQALTRIMHDEIRHVAAGTSWFNWSANRKGVNAPKHYQMLVNRHFRGALKPPFNDSARRQAGLTRDYYMALAY
ncbi:MAG: ferritin-like domain-containing protein [Sphingobium sp.]|nr:ferritin-like domain-containing protein [Sphingobium sp.]MCI1271291.1 ferritin-like domain-containing protein [Sphingobium sp.]MCI1757486.1 ferritin-like domain-containing protein [Sphingobium sp.]MCI2053130.1 ferritin-like domain-containing protein [Sphingobium sp.]